MYVATELKKKELSSKRNKTKSGTYLPHLPLRLTDIGIVLERVPRLYDKRIDIIRYKGDRQSIPASLIIQDRDWHSSLEEVETGAEQVLNGALLESLQVWRRKQT